MNFVNMPFPIVWVVSCTPYRKGNNQMQTTKQNLQDSLRQLRRGYHDSIATTIAECSHKSYSVIAIEHGVSETLVFQIAKQRGLSRNAPETETKR